MHNLARVYQIGTSRVDQEFFCGLGDYTCSIWQELCAIQPCSCVFCEMKSCHAPLLENMNSSCLPKKTLFNQGSHRMRPLDGDLFPVIELLANDQPLGPRYVTR